MKSYIQGLTSGYTNSLIAVSPAGYGKTELVLNTMKEMGYEEGVNYRYLTNFITSLELYKALQDLNHLQAPKLLILDDIEETLKDKKTIGLLKSALWETPNGKRKVCWVSGTYKIKNKEFDFTGRIIFLLNDMKRKDPNVNALADRGFYFEMFFTNQEIIELLEKRVEQPYFNITIENRVKVLDYIKSIAGNSERLSLRILPKAFQAFLIAPNNWRPLVKELL